MEILFQHRIFFHYHQSDNHFALKSNESIALAVLISTIIPLLSMAGISLQYYHKLPDVFE